MKPGIVLLLLFSVVPSLQARTAKHFYSAKCGIVWKAAIGVASQKPYRLQIQNEKDHELMVQTGSYWATGERSISVRLAPKGTGCEGSANGPFAGFTHHDTKDLLKRIAKRLEATESAKTSKPRSTVEKPKTASSTVATASKAAASGTEVPPASVGSKAGTIDLTSSPSGASVYVDGGFVGDTPAKLRLGPGTHNIRLTLSGFQGWHKKILVLAASSVSLAATLKKQ